MSKNNRYWMQLAIEEAQKAYHKDEVPVGAVVVRNGKMISKAHNLKEEKHSSLAHAEVLAIRKAQQKLKKWDLSDCELYVSLEPCLMCTGAIYEARIAKVSYATEDLKGGYFESNFDFKTLPGNQKIKIEKNMMKKESQKLLQDFFEEKRKQNVKIRKIHPHETEEYQALREEVFVNEQGVPLEEEFDIYDDMVSTWHVGAFIGNEIVGTMRLLFHEKHILKIGRLSVKKSHRRQGVGTRLIYYAEKQAKSQNIKRIHLSAQTKAIEFYEKQGYLKTGQPFMDAGIEHYEVYKEIDVSRET